MGVPVNYLAILAAAVSAMVLGSIWYGPLFGKQWIAMMQMTPEQIAKGKADKKGMMRSYGLMFIGALVMAHVLSYTLVFASDYTATFGITAGLMAGFWNWLGFVVPVTLGKVLWEGKSWKHWMLDSGYYLVDLCVMGVILAVWP